MRKRINRMIKPLGLVIQKIKNNEEPATPYLKNVFNTNFKKKVLLSYITSAFLINNNFEHTNLLECYTAGEIFRNLGYNVDVINYNTVYDRIDFSNYDIVYGLGDNFALALNKFTASVHPKTILYGTGVSSTYAKSVTLKKSVDFYNRTGMRILTSFRSSVSLDQVMFSDHIIALGNEFTRKTYLVDRGNKSIANLNAFYYDVYDINLNKKDYQKCSKNILWFGSGGLLHKGLDLAIDAIRDFPDLTLHICGANTNELEFCTYYSDALLGKIPNIVNHQFVKINKLEFRKLMNLCGAVLSPSISEGGAVALLNVMANGGLIPITSEASGVDVNEFGIMINELTLSEVKGSLQRYYEIAPSELMVKSKIAKNEIRKNYSYDIYRENLYKCIKEFVVV